MCIRDILAQVATAFARRRGERIGNDRTRVHSAEGGFAWDELAADEYEELPPIHRGLVDDRVPSGLRGVEDDGLLADPADEPLGLKAVLNQIGDAEDHE